MFSSLRLATMRSHKNRARPGSVGTLASSESARAEDITLQLQQQQFHGSHKFLILDETEFSGCGGPTSVSSKVAQVRVERESGSLGVTLRVGVARTLVVTGVKSDGPAAKEGRVRPGDRLLAVDDTELRGLGLAEAQRALRKSSDAPVASLTIEYDVANMEEARAATSGPLLVQLERSISGEIGLTVRETPSGVYIESLRPASTADRCGALQPGDRLLAVDDIPIQDAVGAAKLLRNVSENCRIARLQIQPRPPSASSRMSKRRAQPQAQQGATQNLYTKESLTVLLRPDHRGLGLALRATDGRMNYVIDILEAGGPAERSGVLLPGDKVIALNRRILQDMQPSEVAAILESQQVELVTEYKVGGPVVPSSGVFTVRVARPLGGQPDLGLTVNEDLVIAEVRRGSLAYRTGSLAPGDRLLAIDGQKLDSGDLRQAALLLHRPGSSVVSLTIRKPDSTPDVREGSISSDTPMQQYPSDTSRSTRESLPSVDSAVDSWGEIAEVCGTVPDSLRQWDTASIDSGQLDLPMTSYSGYHGKGPCDGVGGTLKRAAPRASLQLRFDKQISNPQELYQWAVQPNNLPKIEIESLQKSFMGCEIATLSRSQERTGSETRPQQLVHVSLHKDPVYEDFGFSVSDGLFERGVYINRLRPGGPCDGVLRPYDRILRVNDANTEDCDCCLAVPLIAAAGARLDLTVARPLTPQNITKALI